jgi:alkylhydroperoxidase family enzyme
MPRINPVSKTDVPQPLQKVFDEHVRTYHTRITNMKATLAHSLPAFEVYMQWYVLYEEMKKFLGERLAYLFAWSVSYESNCPLCMTYFRKVMIDKGESPESLELSVFEKQVLDFGSAIAVQQGHIDQEVYLKTAEYFSDEELVLLIAFAGQMIATNIFNNVIQTEIDDYLHDYLPQSFSSNEH